MRKKSSEGLRGVHPGTLQKVLIMGIGNEYRRDDGIGLEIARKIRERHLSRVTVLEESGDGAALMEAWQGYETVILADAISSGAKPGTIVEIDVTKKKVPAKFFHYSTHAFSVAEAIELSRAMKTLPPRLVVFGVEGARFSAGVTISQGVQESVRQVVEKVLERVREVNQE
jgi:hydrogenase maturation protease